MDQQNVYAAHQYHNDQELLSDGFLAYRPVKRVIMMRMLPPEAAPVMIEGSPDDAPLPVPTSPQRWMIYHSGDSQDLSRDDYDLGPIESHIFAETYRRWEDPDWQPTPTEAHLQRLGCMPYYRFATIWGKRLTAESWLKQTENIAPVEAPAGSWLCVNGEGAIWGETDVQFQAHYQLLKQKKPTSP